MFILLAGKAVEGTKGVPDRMASALYGGAGSPRLWVAPERDAAAASLAPDLLPEDAFDTQPLVSDEGVFLCQARLDNREELLDRLNFAPDTPLADSTLLAYAYQRWGGACVDRLVGDFAFAAWRRRDGRVEAAVDPIGARRLYWSRMPEGIGLSAQLRPLLGHPKVSSALDMAAIAAILDAGIERSSTPYTSIRSLPGGHRLVWARGELRVERWWRPNWQPAVWYRDPRDYAAEMRALFMAAVKAQLRSSGSISTTLSGGLDSGAVTAAAAQLFPESRLTAYTTVPEAEIARFERGGWDSDDSGYAGTVASTYPNVDHRLVPPGRRSVLDVAGRAHVRSATPSKNSTNLPGFYAMAEAMAASGSRVLLIGQQGNSAFSWRGQSAVRELAMLGRWREALAQAGLEASGREMPVWRVHYEAAREGLSTLWRRVVPPPGDHPGLKFVRKGLRRGPSARANEYCEVPGTRRFWGVAVTTPRHVWWPDPMAQWGVEYRDPTGDRRLLEKLLQYPQAAFRSGGRPRGLAREASEGLLPDRVRLRRTQGAQAPEAAGLIALHQTQYRAALEQMRAAPECRELFDLNALRESVDTFAGGGLDHGHAQAVNRCFDVGTFLARRENRT